MQLSFQKKNQKKQTSEFKKIWRGKNIVAPYEETNEKIIEQITTLGGE